MTIRRIETYRRASGMDPVLPCHTNARATAWLCALPAGKDLSGTNNSVAINDVSFQVTILAAMSGQ